MAQVGKVGARDFSETIPCLAEGRKRLSAISISRAKYRQKMRLSSRLLLSKQALLTRRNSRRKPSNSPRSARKKIRKGSRTFQQQKMDRV